MILNVKRNKNNYYVFDDDDIAWINNLSCLKNCGMSILEMKEYLKLCLMSEASISKRMKILEVKLKELEHKKNKLEKILNIFIGNKNSTIMY